MWKEYLDKRLNSPWLSEGMKDALLSDYGAVNMRAGRARLGQIAKEVGSYSDLIAGSQRGYMPPPKYVLDTIHEAIDHGAFDYFTGGEVSQELNTHLANRYKQWYGIDFNPKNEIATTVGASFTIDSAVRILTNPGDDVLILDPDYITYESQIASYNRKPVPVPALREDPPGTWNFDIDKLEAGITPKTKLFMFSNANNPSSYMYTEEDCKAIVNMAEQHNLWILNDQVSEEITFDGTKINSILSVPGAKDRTVTCSSYSKLYSLSGFRPAFAFAPPEFIEALNQIVGWVTDGLVGPGVHAMLAYMRNEVETKKFTDGVRASLQERRDYMISRINEMDGIIPNKPQGLYWLWPWVDVKGMNTTSQKLAEFLLKEANVYVRPGTWYGRNAEGHFRLSFCVSMDWIKEGMDKLAKGLKMFQEK